MANKNTSVSLSDHFVEFAERKVNEGLYGSTSEVVRAGLRLLEAQDEALNMLRVAIDLGDQSDTAADFNPSEYLAEIRNGR